MAVVTIVGPPDTLLRTADVTSTPLKITNTNSVAVVNQQVQGVAVKVLAGLPGVQNVFVGPTPPANPQEGWLWVQTS